MANKYQIEIDLSNRDDFAKLTGLMAEEQGPIFDLEAIIRARLKNKEKPLTISEARQYHALFLKMNKNVNILQKLYNQAPYTRRGK